VNRSPRDGDPAGDVFIANIHHFGATLFVKMTEVRPIYLSFSHRVFMLQKLYGE
jgi:hypothetical protein